MSLQSNNLHPEARFWDRIAKRYAKKPVPDQGVYETKLAKTNGYLKPSDHVLEIGCGTGTTAIHHAPYVAQIRATDISENMIAIAKEKAGDAEISNIDFAVASMDDLKEQHEVVDVILAHSILHLLPDVEQVLGSLYDRLKPGGLLISTTACIRDFFPVFGYIAPVGRALGVLPHVNVFGLSEFEQWVDAAGFSVKERWQPNPKNGIYMVLEKPLNPEI